MPLTKSLKEYSTLIEQHLETVIQESDKPYRRLFSAARYSLLGEAKRLRPILLLAATEALGGQIQHALSAASAIELIHTYSLIHDDLPCMDNDDFRRNKPSLHKAFSEAHAVLTGDFMLSYAFELLSSDPYLTPEQKVKLVTLLAKSCGGDGMIGGQVMDIEAEGTSIDQATLECIHQHKTGALITASVAMGAIIANASEADFMALCRFGNDFGLAFQVMDDILDVCSSVQKHGKKMPSDVKNNKTTYVSLLGIEKSKSVAEQLVSSAKKHLEAVQGQTTRLSGLADFLMSL